MSESSNTIPPIRGFGYGYTNREKFRQIEKTLNPDEGIKDTKAGVQALSSGKYTEAWSYFSNAIRTNDKYWEPRIGLSASIYLQSRNINNVSNLALISITEGENLLIANPDFANIEFFSMANIEDGVEFMNWLWENRKYKGVILVANNLLRLISDEAQTDEIKLRKNSADLQLLRNKNKSSF